MSSPLVVVGAGAVGISTALYAQSLDMDVVVVERAHPGAGASGHNGGIFSLGNCLPTSSPDLILRIPRMLVDPLSPLAIKWSYLPQLTPWLIRFLLAGSPRRIEETSKAMVSLLERSVEAYGPLLENPAVLRPGGHVIGFADEQSFLSAEYSLEIRRRRGIGFEVLDGDAIARLDPVLGGVFARGILIEHAPYVHEPSKVLEALAARFVAAGGRIVTGEVVGFEQSAGAVSGVLLTEGRLDAAAVVIAAGAWSKRLAAALGTRLPLDTERGYGVHLPHPGLELKLPLISWDYHIALTPAQSGALRIVGTDELAGLQAPPNLDRAAKLVAATVRLFPTLDVSDAESWMSFRPSMPDSLPVIDRAPGVSNAFLAFGHGHTGFTTAAITGRLITQLMVGATTDVDLAPFRAGRFRLRQAPTRQPGRSR